MTSGLRLVGNNGNFLADEDIHQRGLAHVRIANDGDISRMEVRCNIFFLVILQSFVATIPEALDVSSESLSHPDKLSPQQAVWLHQIIFR